MESQSGTDTVVFIHGLYLTARSWENWEKRFAERGYKVINQNWPGLEVEVEALRKDPTPIAKLSVPNILDHYHALIRGLDKPPIIIGHSFGGAFTQVLVSRGLGAVGIAVHSGTVRGIYDLPRTTLKANWAGLRNPILRHRAFETTPKAFRYAFTNTFTQEAADAAYERYAIAGSRNVLFTGANCNLNPFTPLRVDYKTSKRAPLLFIGGGQDHVIPAYVNRKNAGKYGRSGQIADYIEYPDRPHFTAAAEGWEEVADFALQWAESRDPSLSSASATPLQHFGQPVAA